MNESENGFVSATEVEKRVRELMNSEESNSIRAMTTRAQNDAKATIREGGSSRMALAKLVESWKPCWVGWIEIRLNAFSEPSPHHIHLCVLFLFFFSVEKSTHSHQMVSRMMGECIQAFLGWITLLAHIHVIHGYFIGPLWWVKSYNWIRKLSSRYL